MPPAFDEAWRAYLHEAAHCVVSLELGRAVIAVAVEGETGWFRPRGKATPVALFAGYAAEWRFTHPNETPYPANFARNWDKEDVRRAAERLSFTDGDRLLACWLEAKTMIDADRS